MQGAKRAVQLCCTSDLQRSSAPKAGVPNVHVICERAAFVDVDARNTAYQENAKKTC